MTQRRIAFVTGGAGFIGSNIAAKLAEDRTLDVVVCDRLREAELGKWKNIAKHPIGDFVAPEDMFDWLEKRWRDVEVVVHMAAVSTTMEPDADKIIHSNFSLSRDLFRWCLSDGQNDAPKLNYLPLPPNVTAKALSALSTITPAE